jgi:3-isopropylmalate/(R)-2-methylmalate dehydratase large subunit
MWQEHLVADLGGGTGLILIDRILLHERTGGVALNSLADAGRSVACPEHIFATMDHVVDTHPGRTDQTIMPTGIQFIQSTRKAALAADITLFDLDDPRQGIVHVISPEQGIIQPGATLVCPDSHTCSQGALGALAWGIGSTEAEHALATSTLRVRKPKTMRVTVTGRLGAGVTAKDLALHLTSRIGAAGAKGHVVEFAGEAIRVLDVEGRLTLCNMAAELSAFSALVASDAVTFAYLEGRAFAPTGQAWDRGVQAWQSLATDDGAVYDVEYTIDAAEVAPMVSWGTSPQQSLPLGQPIPDHSDVAERETLETYQRALAYMGLQAGQDLLGLPIDAAFIGSCTNSRLSDLRRAAAVIKGRHVAKGVRAICVPGSTRVKREAEAEGLDRIFRDAGFEWREAGCSMCFFAGGESFAAQERVITSTNRNFESRQGPGSRSHLAAPETVAASAIAGHITDPRRLDMIS